MQEEFIPYELALKLRDLGFGNTNLDFYWGCFAYYGTDKSSFEGKLVPNNTLTKHNKFDYSQFVNAPLWQQAFDWFRKQGLWSWIEDDQELDDDDDFWRYSIKDWSAESYEKAFTFGHTEIRYEDARLECLKKLIEIYGKSQHKRAT